MSLYPDFSLTARQMCTPHPQNRSKREIFLAYSLVPRSHIHHIPQTLPHQHAYYSSFGLRSAWHLQRGHNPVSFLGSWRSWTRQFLKGHQIGASLAKFILKYSIRLMWVELFYFLFAAFTEYREKGDFCHCWAASLRTLGIRHRCAPFAVHIHRACSGFLVH